MVMNNPSPPFQDLVTAVKELFDWLGASHSAVDTEPGRKILRILDSLQPGYSESLIESKRQRERELLNRKMAQQILASTARGKLSEEELSALESEIRSDERW